MALSERAKKELAGIERERIEKALKLGNEIADQRDEVCAEIASLRTQLERARGIVQERDARLSQIAHHILLSVDAYIKAGNDINTKNMDAHEVYNQLYLASDPEMVLLEPWEPLEELAKEHRKALATINGGGEIKEDGE